MILAAGLLLLAGLGLFVGGILTGMTALYWSCVAVCVVAAVLLFLARRQMPAAPGKAQGASTAASVSRPPAATATAPGTGTASANGTTPGTDTTAPAGATAASVAEPPAGRPAEAHLEDPPIEEVEVTDLLLVVDLHDEVLVIDEHPRYHLAGCVHLTGRTPIPLPLDEARADGFTPCAVCAPDRNLAQRARERR